MVELLRGVAGPVVTTTPESERKLTASELAAHMGSAGFDVTPVEAIEDAVATCRGMTTGGRMLVTGSFFVVGEALNVSVDRAG